MRARLGVVYLVWGPLGPEPLRGFLEAYRRLQAGVEHELIVVLNGVGAADAHVGSAAASARAALLGELEGVEHRLLELGHPMLDLAAYFEIAARLEHERLCFLNSHSEPLADGWLELLAAPARERGVGMVGATGSWASQSSHVRYLLGLGGPYARVYDDRESARQLFAPWSAAGSDAGQDAGTDARRTRRQPLKAALLIAREPSFPAPHLRSNAFLLERELMLRLKPGTLLEKEDTYRLESGRRSLTRLLERIGLRVLVAGRDGVGYDSRDWPASETFWQGAQANLVIADNQTRGYARGDFHTRRLLAAHAWGELAVPVRPDDAPAADRAAGA